MAEIEGEIIGYISGGQLNMQKWRPFKRAEVDNIYVRRNCRNQKIGSYLMDTFVNWAKSKGVEKIILYVMVKNTEAIKFYERKLYKKINLVLEKGL